MIAACDSVAIIGLGSAELYARRRHIVKYNILVAYRARLSVRCRVNLNYRSHKLAVTLDNLNGYEIHALVVYDLQRSVCVALCFFYCVIVFSRLAERADVFKGKCAIAIARRRLISGSSLKGITCRLIVRGIIKLKEITASKQVVKLFSAAYGRINLVHIIKADFFIGDRGCSVLNNLIDRRGKRSAIVFNVNDDVIDGIVIDHAVIVPPNLFYGVIIRTRFGILFDI